MSEIVSTGSALPSRVVSSAQIEKSLGLTPNWIYLRTGILERPISDPTHLGDSLIHLAFQSALECLKKVPKNSPPEEIHGIYVATCTHLNPIPSVACYVQKQLENRIPKELPQFRLSKNLFALDINAACSGFLYAWIQAIHFLKPGQKALLIGAEMLSTITDPTDPDTAILFSDGAGAMLIEKKSNALLPPFSVGGNGSHYEFLKQNPESQKIEMKGAQVFKSSILTMEERIYEVCEIAKIKPSEIDFWIPHQANLRIIETLSKRLSIPIEKFGKTIDRYGNSSAATIPQTLDYCLKTKQIHLSQTIGFFSFGAGSTSAALIYQPISKPKGTNR
jgi:3-oxoacyl-[acyl-carrier-protein] synthase-3